MLRRPHPPTPPIPLLPALPVCRWFCFIWLLGNLLLWPAAAPAWADSGAGDRRFRQDFQLEYLDEFVLPSQRFEDTEVGGLSALAYDRRRDRLYGLSDDHGSGPTRFYDLQLTLDQTGDRPRIAQLSVEGVTRLTDAQGKPFPPGSFDPEGLALTPQDSLFVSTEGNPAQGVAPGLFEFDRPTGRVLRSLPVPRKFAPAFESEASSAEASLGRDATSSDAPRQIQGVQTNQGFESLSLGVTGTAPGEPLRLFTATEGPLVQDRTASSLNGTPRNRLLHYYLGEGPPLLLAEHLYPLDPLPAGLFHGLSEILVLDDEGHFLALERALTPRGFDAKLFEITLAGASDISATPSLRGNVRGIEAIAKRLVLDLTQLGVGLDNLEGMAWGPRLADGSRSLLLISDNNFKSFQKTQLLLFRVQR